MGTGQNNLSSDISLDGIVKKKWQSLPTPALFDNFSFFGSFVISC